jgi:hypothetical protein
MHSGFPPHPTMIIYAHHHHRLYNSLRVLAFLKSRLQARFLLGFLTMISSMVWGYQPHAQPPTWRTRVPLFVWVITFDLSGKGDPASSYATADIALRIVWPRKPHYYVKERIPSVGTIYTQIIIITNKNLRSPFLSFRVEYLSNFWEFQSKLSNYSAKNYQCDQSFCESPSHGLPPWCPGVLGSTPCHGFPSAQLLGTAAGCVPSVCRGRHPASAKTFVSSRSWIKTPLAMRSSACGSRCCKTLLWLPFRILSIIQFGDSPHSRFLYFAVLAYFPTRCAVAACFLA